MRVRPSPQLAAAGSSGVVLFGQLRLEDVECGRYTAVLVKPQQISLRDPATGKADEIICKHRVSRIVYGYGYMARRRPSPPWFCPHPKCPVIGGGLSSCGILSGAVAYTLQSVSSFLAPPRLSQQLQAFPMRVRAFRPRRRSSRPRAPRSPSTT